MPQFLRVRVHTELSPPIMRWWDDEREIKLIFLIGLPIDNILSLSVSANGSWHVGTGVCVKRIHRLPRSKWWYRGLTLDFFRNTWQYLKQTLIISVLRIKSLFPTTFRYKCQRTVKVTVKVAVGKSVRFCYPKIAKMKKTLVSHIVGTHRHQ